MPGRFKMTLPAAALSVNRFKGFHLTVQSICLTGPPVNTH
ncbi:hypothetical protein IMCC14465_06980 [alpha proteobacterium IMCC14465]|uniref:Uncharacterized protein n=1 Tax=alpha proteobacterium IMCC14465 TaxID=1220535 RepID=J9DV44_9PROT|nr:hypothetical protein IMCC14465_06980 [alpha proteobacterium IMCC14465]